MDHCKGCSGSKVDKEIEKITKKYKGVDGGIISALHEVQDLYGYIPESVQKYLSSNLDISMSEIYGIITFYSRFSLMPKGKYNVQVCMGTACYVKGAEAVLKEFKEKLKINEGEVTSDGKFSIEAVRCIGACGLAPAIVVNSDVYGKVAPDKVDEIISKYANE
ncbi:MAG: NADH-quinone oxidoreductase subunit NuoE [Clostridia bacterium]|nr:NADH-quinone oxidoreductase subunit NuoE [Clostridia bacterium]